MYTLFYKSASKRAMRAKGWAMRVMRATVKILRIFVCYNFFGMRTRTRATEQDEYERNIEFLQRLHKLSPKRVLISQWEQEQEQQNMIIKFLQRLHKPSPRRVLNQPIRSQTEKFKKLHILLPVKMPLNTARKTFVALSWVFLKWKVYLNVMNIKTEHIWLSRWFLSIA